MRAGRGNFPVKVGHSSRMAWAVQWSVHRGRAVDMCVCMCAWYVCVCMSVCIYDMYVNMYILYDLYIFHRFGLVWFISGLTYVCIHVYRCVYLYIYIPTYITYVTVGGKFVNVMHQPSFKSWDTTVKLLYGTRQASLNLSPVNSPIEVAWCNVCIYVWQLFSPSACYQRNERCHSCDTIKVE